MKGKYKVKPGVVFYCHFRIWNKWYGAGNFAEKVNWKCRNYTVTLGNFQQKFV